MAPGIIFRAAAFSCQSGGLYIWNPYVSLVYSLPAIVSRTGSGAGVAFARFAAAVAAVSSAPLAATALWAAGGGEPSLAFTTVAGGVPGSVLAGAGAALPLAEPVLAETRAEPLLPFVPASGAGL